MIHRFPAALFGVACVALLAASPARAADANAADSAAKDWSKVEEYRIVPGDKLAIDLGPKPNGYDEYVKETTVRPDGRITLFPVGDVVAAGLTPRELQKSVIALLSADLRAPRATVEVVSMAANLVHVLGRVERPSSVPVTAFMTVSQALAAAGGFSPDAARNGVLLIHRDGANSVSVRRVRADQFLKGAGGADPEVGRFDIVYVPRNTVGNISVFLNGIFSGVLPGAQTAFTGWELMNLDRVFSTRIIRQ